MEPGSGGAAPTGSQRLPLRSVGLSLYTGQRVPGPQPRYADLVPLAQAAEAAGFDAFWVSEHHNFDGAYLPSPLIALAAAAASTSRITLGTGLVLGPLSHPLRLAEDAAVVDHLSGGRLVLGIGNGYAPREFAMFGVPMANRGARLEETVAILKQAWRGEPFSFEGSVYRFEDVRVQPASHQTQGIPIWIGAYAPAAIARAGRIADGHLVGRGTPELLAAATEQLAAVRDPQDPTFTLAMNVAVVGSDPRAGGTSARAGYRRHQRAYELVTTGTPLYDPATPVHDPTLTLGSIDNYVQAGGTADEIVDRIGAIVERHDRWPRQHVALRALFPDEDLDVLLRRVDYLGEEVLPPLRARLASGDGSR